VPVWQQSKWWDNASGLATKGSTDDSNRQRTGFGIDDALPSGKKA